MKRLARILLILCTPVRPDREDAGSPGDLIA